MSHLRSQVRAGRFAVLALSIFALAAGLGTSTTALAAGSSNVKVHLSNSSRGGNSCKVSGVTHIYVTISDVQAHLSGKGHRGFTPLTNGSPQQFDLLFASSEPSEAINSNDCPIVDLGGTGLPPGKYQQIRLMTVANTSSGSPVIPADENACVTAGGLADTVYDCVADSTGTYYPLTLPSGSQTGLKIPASQISRGGFSITAGQGADLDVDIDACQSLIIHGPHAKSHGKHGKPPVTTSYAFKPVLHTGEVSLQPIIAGAVYVGTASAPSTPVTIDNPAVGVSDAEVFLEMEPSAPNVTDGTPAPGSTKTSVNTIVAEATTDSDGAFTFCPVPVGTYDIVVDSQGFPHSGDPSDATITTGVVVAQANGPNNLEIPLLAASGVATTLHAQVTTTTNGTVPGTGDDIAFQGTQGFGTGGADQAPIPLYSGTASIPVTTTLTSNGCGSSCPTGSNCVCFPVAVPPDNPVTGTAGGSYTSGAATPEYSLFGSATSIALPPVSECTPSELISSPPDSTLTTPTISFTSCD